MWDTILTHNKLRKILRPKAFSQNQICIHWEMGDLWLLSKRITVSFFNWFINIVGVYIIQKSTHLMFAID